MTPKEKAKELVDRFINQMPKYLQGKLGRLTAIKCVLIWVDEIINTYPTPWSSLDIDPKRDYWIEVKQELKEL